MDCDHRSHGCGGGLAKQAFEWVIQNGGISKEDDYPYEAQNGYCKADTVCLFRFIVGRLIKSYCKVCLYIILFFISRKIYSIQFYPLALTLFCRVCINV